jgi:hypothetical protein
MIQSIAVTKNNEQCEVHFFERWTGYAHPVKLIGPLDLASAFSRGNFQRAWTCKKGTQTLFVLLEGIEITGLESNTAPLSGDLKFYAAQKSTTGLVKGLPISEGKMILANDFFVESFRGGIVTQSVLIHQKTIGKFEYQYNAEGKLSLLRVTNLLGDVNELKY